MKQADKKLLIKDLCARLPYGVKFVIDNGQNNVRTLTGIDEAIPYEDWQMCAFARGINAIPIEDIKPYLFPLSSMTDEQANEMQEIVGDSDDACIMRNTMGLELWLNPVDTDPTIWLDTIFEIQEWLNKNHFDYRGLIEKGLAIDATNLNIY